MVEGWVTRFETHGLTGLRDGVRSGRPATRIPSNGRRLGVNCDASRRSSVMRVICGWAAAGGASPSALWGDVGGASVPTPLRPHGIPTAQAQT